MQPHLRAPFGGSSVRWPLQGSLRWSLRWSLQWPRPWRAACTALLIVWPGSAWPQAAADAPLSLSQLVERALASNPQLVADRLARERAVAQSDVIDARLGPQVSLQGSLTRNHYDAPSGGPDQNHNGRRLTLSARQPVWDAPQQLRGAAARSEIEQLDAEVEATQATLVQEIAARYAEALQALDTERTLSAEKTMVSRQRDRLEAMHRRQLAKVTELLEAEAYLATLGSREVEAANARRLALDALADLSGQPVAAVVAMKAEAPGDAPADLEDWLARARVGNARLVALEQAVQSARLQQKAAAAEWQPKAALLMTSAWADQGYDYVRQPRYRSLAIGFEFSVPLWDSGLASAGERVARAGVGIAEQALEAGRREVEQGVREAWRRAQANHARASAAAVEVKALERALDAQEKGFELGANGIVDVLDAQRRLTKAREEQARARHELFRNWVALTLRAEGHSPSALQRWDRWFATARP